MGWESEIFENGFKVKKKRTNFLIFIIKKMSKKKHNIPLDLLAHYEKLIHTVPEIEIKGASTRYTSLNGNMFSFISKDGDIGLRLSEADRATFIEKFETELQVQHGRVMKEYVAVPESFFKNSKAIKKWMTQSYEYAKSLKPKPTKKK